MSTGSRRFILAHTHRHGDSIYELTANTDLKAVWAADEHNFRDRLMEKLDIDFEPDRGDENLEMTEFDDKDSNFISRKFIANEERDQLTVEAAFALPDETKAEVIKAMVTWLYSVYRAEIIHLRLQTVEQRTSGAPLKVYTLEECIESELFYKVAHYWQEEIDRYMLAGGDDE